MPALNMHRNEPVNSKASYKKGSDDPTSHCGTMYLLLLGKGKLLPSVLYPLMIPLYTNGQFQLNVHINRPD